MLLGILKRSVECICSDRFEFRRQGELLQAATTSECKIRYLCDVVIQLYFFQSLTTIKQRLAQFGRAFYRRFFSASIPAKDISSIFFPHWPERRFPLPFRHFQKDPSSIADCCDGIFSKFFWEVYNLRKSLPARSHLVFVIADDRACRLTGRLHTPEYARLIHQRYQSVFVRFRVGRWRRVWCGVRIRSRSRVWRGIRVRSRSRFRHRIGVRSGSRRRIRVGVGVGSGSGSGSGVGAGSGVGMGSGSGVGVGVGVGAGSTVDEPPLELPPPPPPPPPPQLVRSIATIRAAASTAIIL